MLVNKIKLLLASIVLSLFTMQGYAISPGAGQAQIRNNMQTLEQNKQQMKRLQQTRQNHQVKRTQRSTVAQ